MGKSPEEIVSAFHEAVNMSARELEAWLGTEESSEVGFHRDADESVGHESGRRIVELLRAHSRSGYSDDDLAHMNKVVGYVHRHLAQRPAGDVSHTRWASSLKNWGHDPMKDRRDASTKTKAS